MEDEKKFLFNAYLELINIDFMSLPIASYKTILFRVQRHSDFKKLTPNSPTVFNTM